MAKVPPTRAFGGPPVAMQKPGVPKKPGVAPSPGRGAVPAAAGGPKTKGAAMAARSLKRPPTAF
jgi:hypothetical protein